MSKNTQILILVSLTAFLRPFAQLIYVPSQISLGADYGISLAVVGLTLSVYALVFAFAQIFFGPIVDRFDGQRIMLIGTAIFILASLGAVFSKSIENFLAMRALQGLGIAAMVIVGIALISDAIPQNERGKAMGVFEIFNAAGAAAAPMIGALVAIWFSWRFDFLVLVMFGILIGMFTYWRFPQQVKVEQRVGLVEMISILRAPTPFGSILDGFVKFYSIFTVFALIPVFLVTNLSLSESQSGVITSLLPISAMGGSFIGGRAADKYNNRSMMLWGSSITLVAFSAMTYLSSTKGSMSPSILLGVSIVIAGLAIGFCLPMQLKLVVDYYPDMRATASGLLIFSRFIGSAITPVVSGYLASTVSVAAGFGLNTLMIAIALIMMFFTIQDKES
jgi:DHA1 family bicyclomycin/chloramphenicol resistance-like MFS transporter